MPYRAYLFDLDGTLLDTLPDLVRLTNMVLERRGMPQRTRDEVLSFVGAGGHALLERAMPAGTPPAEVDGAFELWRELYPTYGHALTRPYPGISEVLAQLKADGARLGVLSNKFDAAVRDVIGARFPGVFDIARGECDEIPRKPDPCGLQLLMRQLGVASAETAYVGDSATDMAVAIAAGAAPIGVSWGYQDVDALRAAGALAIVDDPAQLAAL